MEKTPHMRTGLLDEPRTADVTSVIALMRAFAKEACLVSAKYAKAHKRNVVTAEDMRSALKYTARTYLYQGTDALDKAVRGEMECMEEESDDTDGESEGGATSDEADACTASEGGQSDENEGDDAGGAQDDCADCNSAPPSPTMSDKEMKRLVDGVVTSWESWHPTDPVHQLVRNAIEQTALPLDRHVGC